MTKKNVDNVKKLKEEISFHKNRVKEMHAVVNETLAFTQGITICKMVDEMTDGESVSYHAACSALNKFKERADDIMHTFAPFNQPSDD